MTSRQSCVDRDLVDPLRHLRDQFSLPADVVYLDGNSLGAQPRDAAERVRATIEQQWGRGLIRSWNTAGWIDMPAMIGDKIARLIGAEAGAVVVSDSTSVNLFKVLHAATEHRRRDAMRSVVLSERGNFPTDLYIADAAAQANGLSLRLAAGETVLSALDDSVAVLLLTQVDYRTGRLHDMATITRVAHDAGALMIWDLAHSAGVIPIDLMGVDADAAVGCGYKFLNGGPGAPAFVWINPRHSDRWRSPLPGWMGHDAPFAFETDYQPAPGIARFQCGTPPILSLVALEAGVDAVLAAEPCGGVEAIRDKSIGLTTLFIDLVDQFGRAHDLEVVTPREAGERGSQVSIAHPTGGYGIVQALIERGVIGDFRAPDIARFGFAPLYTRFVDVWDAAASLAEVMESGAWRDDRFRHRLRAT